MRLSSWYINNIGIIVIILQQVSIKSSAMRRDEGCRKQEKFVLRMVVPNNVPSNLESFDISCTAEKTVFEVRFVNGKLCACGRHDRINTPLHQNCNRKLPLDFMVNISLNKDNPSGENCTFTFNFMKKEAKLTAFMRFTSAQVISSSFIVSHAVTSIFTHVITSYVTSSVVYNSTSRIGQLPTTSSLMIYQSEVGDSTTSCSRQISSTIPSPPSSPSSYLLPESSHASSQSSYSIPQSSHVIPQSSYETSQTSYATSSYVIPFYSLIIIRETETPAVQPTSSLPTLPVLVTSSMEESPILKTSTSIKASQTTSVVLTSTSLSPEAKEMKKFKEDMELISKMNISDVNVNDDKTIGRILDAVGNLISTNVTTADQKEDPGQQAVEFLEDLGNSISQQLDLGNESSVTFQKVTPDLVFGAAVINVTTSPGLTFPADKDSTTGDEKVDIPKSVFVSQSGKAYFVGIIFKAYREMRNNTGNKGFEMGTKVINAVVSPAPNDVLKEPVEMTFEKNIIGQRFSEEACSFWIENSSLVGDHGRWSTKQCNKTFETKTHIKCGCYHFTNFAVLFKVSDDKASDEDSFRLAIITYVGLSLSILGCLLTFIIYVTFSNIKSDRAIIHVNLVLALGIADVIFLVTVAVKPDGDSCLVAAMLAFYFYLAVFFWMLVEGVYIYLMVIKVFRGNVARRRQLAFLVGWGCPVLIAIVTWAVLRDDVISKYHCWLSVESGAIWAFVGPGLTIILINLVILAGVMRTTWATFVDDKEYGGLRSATKTFGAVIPILGITWVFGVMAFNESSVVFQYIFAITNSIQGALIFVLYCIVNNEVRSELNRRFAAWQTRREMSSSSGGGRRPTYVISSEKNTTFNRTTPTPQESPNLARYPLQEMKEKPSLQVEVGYTFDSVNSTPKNDSELGMEVEKGVPDAGADRDSGRSSPVLDSKQNDSKMSDSRNDSKVNDACDEVVRYV